MQVNFTAEHLVVMNVETEIHALMRDSLLEGGCGPSGLAQSDGRAVAAPGPPGLYEPWAGQCCQTASGTPMPLPVPPLYPREPAIKLRLLGRIGPCSALCCIISCCVRIEAGPTHKALYKALHKALYKACRRCQNTCSQARCVRSGQIKPHLDALGIQQDDAQLDRCTSQAQLDPRHQLLWFQSRQRLEFHC